MGTLRESTLHLADIEHKTFIKQKWGPQSEPQAKTKEIRGRRKKGTCVPIHNFNWRKSSSYDEVCWQTCKTSNEESG